MHFFTEANQSLDVVPICWLIWTSVDPFTHVIFMRTRKLVTAYFGSTHVTLLIVSCAAIFYIQNCAVLGAILHPFPNICFAAQNHVPLKLLFPHNAVTSTFPLHYFNSQGEVRISVPAWKPKSRKTNTVAEIKHPDFIMKRTHFKFKCVWYLQGNSLKNPVRVGYIRAFQCIYRVLRKHFVLLGENYTLLVPIPCADLWDS